ncbi:unnamed protein product [Prorocentrum cordatum]|uniref:CNH domain-containing protein n=1 Tax=Prorocentrum cordatum TaxID=2364126 RepID=A0ABN9UPI9_9DINO|nr:unnamed protein product [Polarella glacialis]
MRKGMEPFRMAPLLKAPELKVESMACMDDCLYVGCSDGSLVQFRTSWPSASPAGCPAAATDRSKVQLSRRPVEQIQASHGLVLALADSTLSVLSKDIRSSEPVVVCRDAKRFCFHTGAEQVSPREEGSDAVEICVSVRKKLVLYTRCGMSFEQKQEFPTSDYAHALVWHQSWICAGFKREYSLFSDTAGLPREICSLDGKMLPQIVLAPGNELVLLIQESVGLLYNLGTQQPAPKSTLCWPRKVINLTVAGSYAVGTTGVGQVDIFGVRDQKNCQTLTLEGSTTAVCCAVGGRALIAAGGVIAITTLDPVPFARQMEKLLVQLRVSDALDLLNATLDPESPQREEQLARFHEHAGWAMFRDLQFTVAFQHFMYSTNFRLEQLLLFWRRHLPSGWQPAADLAQRTAESGAPEPLEIEQFVRHRLEEKHTHDESAVSANVDLANNAMVMLLTRQREALQATERMHREERPPWLKDPSALLRAVDAVLLRLLVETGGDDARLQRLLDEGMRCAPEDCEGFLRQRRRPDVLARVWRASGKHGLVLEELAAALQHPDGGRAASRGAPQIAAEMADVLKAASGTPAGPELLRRYIPMLIATEPNSVLPVVAVERQALDVDDVLQLLQGHGGLTVGYLEHVVLGKPGAEPRHQAQLAQGYIAQVAEEQQGSESDPGRGVVTVLRRALLRFLEGAGALDARALLPQVEQLGLHEERVVLHCREQQHEEALGILVDILDDLPRAEMYCRVVAARQSPAPFAAQGDGSQEAEVSLFCADPPLWAQGVVFGKRKEPPAGAAAEWDGPGCSRGPPPGGAVGSAGPRPLMSLLRVLLAAADAADQRPAARRKVSAEYRDAVLSLLTGYAGHRDLPPHEAAQGKGKPCSSCLGYGCQV